MTMPMHAFGNRHDLAAALAGRVAQALSKCISQKGRAVLAVSGGTTPALFFDFLSHTSITWEKVTVTLVDERQVGEDHARSNARLVRRNLLVNAASQAAFVPLFGSADAAGKLKPDCVVLGMGEDGHTASFFPGGDRLTEALDPGLAPRVITMQAPAAGEPRLTFTLSALLGASHIFLHIEGERKVAVLAQAQKPGDTELLPIRAILQSGHPVDIYWCP